MEETNKYSSVCKPPDKQKGKCYGGVARLRQAVNELKQNNSNVVWLNGGDFFQGTVWYTQFKWRVVSQFNNLLNFDAMTLGNHEFDDSISGLVPFLQNQSCPIVVSNLNTSQVPELSNLTRPSIKLNRDGKVIGIVGYITPDTKSISNPGENLIFVDEIEALKIEVKKLHDEGVDIIIALGHSGYEKDKDVALNVPHVDVVVGAHSHSFLFTPTKQFPNPSNNEIIGPYPTLIENKAGHKTIVVQAYAHSKYLGHMKLHFSEIGDLEDWSGSPILLDSNHAQDQEVLDQLKPWKEKLIRLSKDVIGSTAHVLDISRSHESTLGNFVADAMVRAWENKTMPDGSHVRIALCNSGGIRAAFDKGNVTMEDILTTFPFSNTFDVVSLKGRYIREALEHSVDKFTNKNPNAWGGFLHVSGLQVVYNLDKNDGDRVVSLTVGDGKDLEDEQKYNIVTSNYVLGGGDGYTMISENYESKVIGDLDTDVMKYEFSHFSPVSAKIEGRIKFEDQTNYATPLKIDLLVGIAYGILALL